jgi:choline kinase
MKQIIQFSPIHLEWLPQCSRDDKLIRKSANKTTNFLSSSVIEKVQVQKLLLVIFTDIIHCEEIHKNIYTLPTKRIQVKELNGA